MKFKYIPSKNGWYTIHEAGGSNKIYGSFLLTTVPRDPKYTKHLDLELHEECYEDIILLIDVCKFAFDSVLEITANEGMKICKIKAHKESFIRALYEAFIQTIVKNGYEVSQHASNHGKWIVIKKISE